MAPNKSNHAPLRRRKLPLLARLKPGSEPPSVSQARLAAILDIADDAIISINDRQQITLFNQGAERLFGYAAQEALGQSLDMLLPARFGTAHRHHMADFATSADAARRMGERQDIFGRLKDGSEFPAEASISKLEFAGEMIFTVILRAQNDALERANMAREARSHSPSQMHNELEKVWPAFL